MSILYRLYPILLLFHISFISNCTSSSLIKKGKKMESLYFYNEAEEYYKKAVNKKIKNVKSFVELAKFYFKNGQHGKGLIILKKALSLNPNSTALWKLLSVYYMNTNDYPDAYYAIEKAISIKPKNKKLLKMRKQINLRQLISQCKHKIAQFPNNTIYRKQLGFLYLNNGYINMAIEQFDQILNVQKNNKPLLEIISIKLLNKKNYPKAKEYLKKLLTIEPRNTLALNSLGDIALKEGYIWKAYRLYFSNAKFNPNDGKAFEKVGYLALRMGKKNKAKEFLERAVKLGMRNYKIYSRLGHIMLSFENENKKSEALKYFELASDFSSPMKKRLIYKGEILKEINRLSQFATFFTDNSYKSAEINYQITKNYIKIKKYEKAYKHIKLSLANMPDSFLYNLYKGKIEFKLGMLGKSISSFKTCLKINPNKKSTYYEFSQIYKKGPLKNDIKYLSFLKKGISKNTNSSIFYKEIGDYYLKNKKIKTAVKYYQTASSLGLNINNKIEKLNNRLKFKKLLAKAKKIKNKDRLFDIALEFKKLSGASSYYYRHYLEKSIKNGNNNIGLYTLLGEAYAKAFLNEMKYDFLQKSISNLKIALNISSKYNPALSIFAQINSFNAKLSKEQIINQFLKWKNNDIITDHLKIDDKICLHNKLNIMLSHKYFSIAKIMYNKNKDYESVNFFKKAMQLSYTEAIPISLALGSVYRKKGEYSKAIKFYKNLLKIKNKPIHKQYNVLLILLGNLYSSIAKSMPYSLTYFKQNYSPNGPLSFKISKQISKDLQKASLYAKYYYKSYINTTGKFFSHKLKCLERIKNLVSIDLDESSVFLRIANLYLKSGKNKRAVDILSTGIASIKNVKKQKKLYIALTDVLKKLNDIKNLKIIYSTIVKKYPYDWKNFYNYGKFLFTKGELNRSIRVFEKSSILNRYDSDIKSILGFLYWQKGDYKSSITKLTEAININENNLNAPYYIFKILFEQNKVMKAIKHGKKVITLFKKNIIKLYQNKQQKAIFLDTLKMLSRAAFYQKDFINSLKYAYEGMDFDTSDKYHFRVLIGDIFYLQKKYKEASFYYNSAIAKHPNISTIKYKLAQVYLLTDKKMQAHTILKKLYYRKKDFIKRADLSLVLSSYYLSKKKYKIAKNILIKMIKEFPYLESGYIKLANLYKQKNNFKKSKDILETGLNIIKKAPEIQDTLAWFLIEYKGNYLRAKHLAMENVIIYPKNNNYRATLNYIYLKLKKFKAKHKYLLSGLINRKNHNKSPFTKLINMKKAAEFYRTGNYKKAFDTIAWHNKKKNIHKRFDNTLFTYLIENKQKIN